MANKSYYIYGINPIKLLIHQDKSRILQIKSTGKLNFPIKDINFQQTTLNEINNLFPNLNHQSVIAKIKAKEALNIEDIISNEINDTIIMLDRITDVGNIGAIIRTAIAFNITKFIIPKHDSCKEMAILAKASSGYSEICQICEVTNLNHAMDKLKNHQYWFLGLDGKAKANITKIKDFEKSVIILGNEHKGIRDGVKQNCDLLVNIPIDQQVESLNVSVAAAIAYYNN